jgi:hypothetical protein
VFERRVPLLGVDPFGFVRVRSQFVRVRGLDDSIQQPMTDRNTPSINESLVSTTTLDHTRGLAQFALVFA